MNPLAQTSSSQGWAINPIKFAKRVYTLTKSSATDSQSEILQLISKKPTKEQFGIYLTDIKKILLGLADEKIARNDHPDWIKKLISKDNRDYYHPTYDLNFDVNIYCTGLLKILNESHEKVVVPMPNDKEISNPLHIACQWEDPNAGLLIDLLIKNHPNYLNEEDGYGNTPFFRLISSPELTKGVLAYILSHNHPNTPSENQESSSSIYHGYWLETLIKSNHKTLILEYITIRPWSIIPLDIATHHDSIYPKEYMNLKNSPHPLELCEEELIQSIGAIWDQKMLQSSGINFSTLLNLQRIPHEYYSVDSPDDDLEFVDADWLKTHPLFTTHFPTVIETCILSNCLVESLLTALNFWKQLDVGEVISGKWINTKIPLIIYYMHDQDHAISCLTHVLKEAVTDIKPKILFDTIRNIHLRAYQKNPEFGERILSTIIDIYAANHKQEKLFDLVPFLLLINNLKFKSHFIKKFQGMNSINFLNGFIYNLLKGHEDVQKEFDPRILRMCLKFGLLNPPSEYTTTNPLASVFFNDDPISIEYLSWMLRNIPWLISFVDHPTSVMNTVVNEAVIDRYHHLLNIDEIPFSDTLNLKISLLLPYARIFDKHVAISLLKQKISDEVFQLIKSKLTLKQISGMVVHLNKKFAEELYDDEQITLSHKIISILEETPKEFVYNLYRKILIYDDLESIPPLNQLLELLPQVEEETLSELEKIANHYNLKFEEKDDPLNGDDIPDLSFDLQQFKIDVYSSLSIMESLEVNPFELHLLPQRFTDFIEKKVMRIKSVENFFRELEDEVQISYKCSLNDFLSTYPLNFNKHMGPIFYLVGSSVKPWIGFRSNKHELLVKAKQAKLKEIYATIIESKKFFTNQFCKKIMNNCDMINKILRKSPTTLNCELKEFYLAVSEPYTKLEKYKFSIHPNFKIHSLIIPSLFVSLAEELGKSEIYTKIFKYLYVNFFKGSVTEDFDNLLNEIEAHLEFFEKEHKQTLMEINKTLEQIDQLKKSPFYKRVNKEIITTKRDISQISCSSSDGHNMSSPQNKRTRTLKGQYVQSLKRLQDLSREGKISELQMRLTVLEESIREKSCWTVPKELDDRFNEYLVGQEMLTIDTSLESPKARLTLKGLEYLLTHIASPLYKD